MAAPRRRLGRGPAYNIFWTMVFIVGVATLLLALYHATRKVDYIWRWNRLPEYFVNHKATDIRAMDDGVVRVEKDGKHAVVIITPADASAAVQRVEVLPDDVLTANGDSVQTGDIVARTRHWEAGILTQGMLLTLKISVISILLGIFIGLGGGLSRLSENPALRYTALVYVELIRGSPLLVQIYLWYFVFGTLINNLLRQAGWPLIPEMWFGIASMAVFAGAYITEVVRAGIQSIHRGQMEAARSLGMSKAQAMRKVIIPQALKRILPPLTGEFIALIKDSSLLGVIAIRELTKATREVVSSSLQPFELWFTCAALYLLLTSGLSYITRYLERQGGQGR